MSALPLPGRASVRSLAAGALSVRGMKVSDLDAVTAIESAIYAFPWTRGNFIDTLAAGHLSWVLQCAPHPDVVGYLVAMSGAGEMHLLNLSVAAQHQRCGLGHWILERLIDAALAQHAQTLWLEVRVSNTGAQSLYRRHGFEERGVRKRYYPAADGAREDAIVMSLPLSRTNTEGEHAAD